MSENSAPRGDRARENNQFSNLYAPTTVNGHDRLKVARHKDCVGQRYRVCVFVSIYIICVCVLLRVGMCACV